MSLILYLIGPSGVGKSACGQSAAAQLRVEICSLDILCRGRTNDWNFCQGELDRAELGSISSSGFVIIDIGAGTQHDCAQQLLSYLQPRQQRVMLIYAPPKRSLPAIRLALSDLFSSTGKWNTNRELNFMALPDILLMYLENPRLSRRRRLSST